MSRSVWIALIFCTLVTPARAITVAPLSFDELVNESTVVIDGRVSDVHGQWTEDRRSIETLVSVEVVGRFKGSPGETLTFIVPGGQVGRYRNVIPGAPSFTPGDRAVLFLKARGPWLPIPTGFTQGIYRVAIDSQTGAAVVMSPVVDTAQRIVRGDRTRKPVALARFEAAVRAVRPVVR